MYRSPIGRLLVLCLVEAGRPQRKNPTEPHLG
jgi:hypothetical protein